MPPSSDSFMNNRPHSLFRGCSESQTLSSLFSNSPEWLVPNLHSPDAKTSSSSPSLLQHLALSMETHACPLHCSVLPSSFHLWPCLLHGSMHTEFKAWLFFHAFLQELNLHACQSLAPWLETSARPLRLGLYPVLLACISALRSLS